MLFAMALETEIKTSSPKAFFVSLAMGLGAFALLSAVFVQVVNALSAGADKAAPGKGYGSMLLWPWKLRAA